MLLLGIRKRSNSSYVLRICILQLRGWDQRESSASLLQPYHHNNVRMYYVRHDEFAHKVRNIHKVFFVNSQWYERALETFAGLPVGRFARSFYTVTTYDVCMYVCTSLRLITKANFFYCMMTLTAWWIKCCCCCNCMLQNFREYIFFLFSLRLLLACFVKFFKAELCDKYLVGAVSYIR